MWSSKYKKLQQLSFIALSLVLPILLFFSGGNVFAETLLDSYTTGDGTDFALDHSNYYIGTSFTISSSTNIGRIEWFLKKVGSPTGTLTTTLKACDGSGLPTGSSLSSGTVSASTLTTSFVYTSFDITDVTEPSGTYCIYVNYGTTDASNYVRISTNSTGGVSGKKRIYNTSGTWNTDTQMTRWKLYDFTVPAPSVPTLSGTAGNHQNTLNWTAPAYATGYNLKRGTTVIYTGSATTYVDTGLTDNVSYTYYIEANNTTGSSGYSSGYSLTPTYAYTALGTDISHRDLEMVALGLSIWIAWLFIKQFRWKMY